MGNTREGEVGAIAEIRALDPADALERLRVFLPETITIETPDDVAEENGQAPMDKDGEFMTVLVAHKNVTMQNLVAIDGKPVAVGEIDLKDFTPEKLRELVEAIAKEGPDRIREVMDETFEKVFPTEELFKILEGHLPDKCKSCDKLETCDPVRTKLLAIVMPEVMKRFGMTPEDMPPALRKSLDL